MKKISSLLMILIILISFVSCEDTTPQMVWKATNRTQLIPIAWGYTLYSAQDTYGLLDGFGDVVWEREIQGARRPRWTCIEGSYFIEGDNHLVLKVNIEDGELLWGWRAPSGSSVWIAGKIGENLILAYDQYSDYDKNPVTLLALSALDSKTLWKIVDSDYSGILSMPSPRFESEALIIPTESGGSYWIDGVSAVDGNHLWRIPWDAPPAGWKVVLAENKDYFWAWRVTGNTYQVSTINKMTGEVIGTAQTPVKKVLETVHTGNRVFVKFEDEIGFFDNIVTYQKIESDWMPICEVFEIPKQLIATSSDCHSIGIMNTTDWSVETFKTISMCYSGVTDTMPGGFFLIPNYSPYDNATFRYVVPNEGLGNLIK
ncbi:MAG: PQQ-binding-like beta-propeller repeat protein [Caldisericia bacterium]